MPDSTPTIAEQLAHAARAFQRHLTGREPKSVNVVLSGDTLVVTLHGVLSPAEQALAQRPDGVAKMQEFHRQLFLNASGTIREQIQSITGLDVREATADVVFASGTMVQVFLLSGSLPSTSYNSGPPPK